MKRGFILATCMAAVLVYAGTVLAQTNPRGQQTVTKTPRVTKRKIMGIVKSVDPMDSTIVVTFKNAEKTFKVIPTTRVILSGKASRLENIGEGTKATIYYRGGVKKPIAVEIIVQLIAPPAETPGKPAERQNRE